MADRRRAGIVAVLVLLAGGLLLGVLPAPGAARVFGVGLLWWYCLVAAPFLALVAAVVALPSLPRSYAAWISPALVATLLARVFLGAPDAPLLILAAATGPLLGVLASPGPTRRDCVAAAAGMVSAGLLVWAGLLLAGDLAQVLGRGRWQGTGVAGAVALAASLPAVARLRAGLVMVGIVVLAAPVVALTARGLSPWHAWTAVASRPALVFAERGPAAREGIGLQVVTTMDFDEPHRVTALGPATYRVIARDGDVPAVREWRLDLGNSLMLRPGDRLELATGVRVRFEAGKRIPGAPISGVAWADPADRDHAVGLGVAATALTLAAGTAALVAGRRTGRSARQSRRVILAALSVPPLLALLAACWGVYAVYAAPELALGAPPVATLAGLPALLPVPLWPDAALLAALMALAAIFAAGVSVLGERVLDLAGARPAAALRLPQAWVATIVVSAGLAVLPLDPWRALVWGFGFTASTLVAPALASERGQASRASAVTGAVVFAGLALGGRALMPWAPVVADYPALAAVPVAWVVGATSLGRWLPARGALRVPH
jgi:hypothetical protein